MSTLRAVPESPGPGRPLNRHERRRAQAQGQGLSLEGWLGQPARRVEMFQEIEEFKKTVLDQFEAAVKGLSVRLAIMEAALTQKGLLTVEDLKAAVEDLKQQIQAKQAEARAAAEAATNDARQTPEVS